MRTTPVLLAGLMIVLLLAPTVSARTVTREYYGGNGAAIIYMSNYYATNADIGGNRFPILAGESQVNVTIGDGPSTSIVQLLDATSNVIASKFTCDGSASLSLPVGAKFVRVFVGSDAYVSAALFPGAPTCGVLAPPVHGFITATFS